MIIAALTGGIIGWQAWEIRKATSAGQKAAQTALDQIVLTKTQTDWLLAKERPELSVQLEPFDPFQERAAMRDYYVRGTMSIRGHAAATILRTAICVSPDRYVISIPFEYFESRTRPSDLHLTLDEIDELGKLPAIIPAGTSSTPFIAKVYGGPQRAATDEEVSSITNRQSRLYCKAVIEFSDSLGMREPVNFMQSFKFECAPRSREDVPIYGTWERWEE